MDTYLSIETALAICQLPSAEEAVPPPSAELWRLLCDEFNHAEEEGTALVLVRRMPEHRRWLDAEDGRPRPRGSEMMADLHRHFVGISKFNSLRNTIISHLERSRVALQLLQGCEALHIDELTPAFVAAWQGEVYFAEDLARRTEELWVRKRAFLPLRRRELGQRQRGWPRPPRKTAAAAKAATAELTREVIAA